MKSQLSDADHTNIRRGHNAARNAFEFFSSACGGGGHLVATPTAMVIHIASRKIQLAKYARMR